MSDMQKQSKEPIDGARRAALKKFSKIAAGSSVVAISASEVLAQASYQGIDSSTGSAAGGGSNPSGRN